MANIAKREQPDRDASQPQRIPPNPILKLNLGVFLLGFLPIRARSNQNLRTAIARSLKGDRPQIILKYWVWRSKHDIKSSLH
ncbi:MAG TPA: hypothetical protein DD001_01490, partial [Microcoleaceae bacterium UBA10368]|nr:hypothetical protein [Microcoleaceae cyanobacterium UBA10368]